MSTRGAETAPVQAERSADGDASATPSLDLVALVRAAQGGDRLAFADLYARFAALVHGVLLTHVDHDDVSDLVQDVFMRAMTCLPTLREPQAFGAWLTVMARNRAIDFRRRRRPTVTLSDEVADRLADDRGATPSMQIEALAVLRVVRALPDAYRETLVLRLVEGLTGPEIAAMTGLTPGSVRVNLHRGMKLLRARLQGSAADE